MVVDYWRQGGREAEGRETPERTAESINQSTNNYVRHDNSNNMGMLMKGPLKPEASRQAAATSLGTFQARD